MHLYTLFCILLHSGIKEEDVEFDWEQDKYTFDVKLKWPIFITKVLVTITLYEQEFINKKKEVIVID